MTRTLSFGLITLLAPGCLVFFGDGGHDDTVVCTTLAASSVSVNVVDEAGSPLAGATVTYAVDGGAEQACDDFGGGSFACGYEIVGTFEIRVTAPERIEVVQTVEVGMEDDGCHVASRVIEVSLVPLCDEPPAAMVVTVLAPDGSAAVGESVLWGHQETDGLPRPCDEDPGSGLWYCAPGSFGGLDLYVEPAEGDPYASVSQQVEVPHGDCGPVTQELTVTLQFLPD